MNGRTRILQFVLGLFIVGALGCGPAHPVYLNSRGRIEKHYIKSATRIEYPDTQVERISEVLESTTPYTIANPDLPREYFDLTLEEAISTTMQNSRIIRTLTGIGFSAGGTSGTPQGLLGAPASVATVYDIAWTESSTGGVEAALSAFDAQLNAALGWTYSDTGLTATPSDNGSFQTSISKRTASGGTFEMRNENAYYSGTGMGSGWGMNIRGGFRQSLLRGGGVEFNRIAGPGASVGSYHGVAIARINTDTAITDFEMSTRELVYDVERAYWNLYYAYHYLESIKTGYASAQKTWSMINRKLEAGALGGDAQSEAQTRNQYFTFRSQVEDAQNNLFKAEGALRYIMGVSPTDGRLFRPSSEPTLAPLALDWNELVVEALSRAPELRKQKWEIKKKELELTASRNFLLPNLDLSAAYQFSGVGHDWINSSHHSNAFASMTGGNYQGWTLGLEYSKTIGDRLELAGVRNATLALARAQAVLQQQELELTHQLVDSFRDIAKYYRLCETGLQRRLASEAEVQAVTNFYNVGSTTIDKVLDAQQRLATAEASFYNYVVSYNLAISELHKRKGTLLEYNNVYLLEGPWPNQAYYNARELARKRDAGHYVDYAYTNPQVFSRGAYQQFQGLESTKGVDHSQGSYIGDDLQPVLQQDAPTSAQPLPVEPGPQAPEPVNDLGTENQPRPLRQIAAKS